MSVQIKKQLYQAKDGTVKEYYYKYGCWREAKNGRKRKKNEQREIDR